MRKRPLKPLLLIDQAADGTYAGGDAAIRTVKGRLAYATTGWSSTIGDPL